MTDGRPNLLIADADAEFRARTSPFLAEHGFAVFEADNLDDAQGVLEQHGVEVVVFDVKIPGDDCLAIARALSSQANACVIIVSELSSEVDRIVGLEAGADDYLAKPASPRELLARIRAIRRRLLKTAQAELLPSASYQFGEWSFDLDRRVLYDRRGVVTNLSDGEFTLLRAFVERPQRVLSRDQLLEYARGGNSDAYDRAIDTQISRLRRKLGANSGERIIRTVRNEGYIFVPRVAAAN